MRDHSRTLRLRLDPRRDINLDRAVGDWHQPDPARHPYARVSDRRRRGIRVERDRPVDAIQLTLVDTIDDLGDTPTMLAIIWAVERCRFVGLVKARHGS